MIDSTMIRDLGMMSEGATGIIVVAFGPEMIRLSLVEVIRDFRVEEEAFQDVISILGQRAIKALEEEIQGDRQEEIEEVRKG